eukprot:GEMP01056675.1.p1 GENE.GEMP01056675.1~~GEMP01056675.1.p1  ORF type:complete len:249 (+),score=62.83 GEMP01056675.1:158-904(+)
MTDWEDVTGRSRNTGTDTAHEKTTVGPGAGTYHKKSATSTGFTNQMAGVLAGDVMERAMADKMKLAEGSQELAVARGEEEEQEKIRIDKDIDDADDDLDAIRARRLAEMKRRAEEQKELQAKGHGTYEEITEEEFLPTVTNSHRCIVHFYHRSFERSKIMDMHLKKMAKKFFRTRFVKLDAEKSPFFVAKLQIQTLPTACAFINGVLKHKQVGFDGLCGDEFKTGLLARIFREWEMVEEDFDSEGDIA